MMSIFGLGRVTVLKVTLVATAALLAAWLLALAVKVEPSKAAFPGHNGKIVFQSFRDGNSEIYTMNPDGTNQTNISNNAADDAFPAWSPDGTKIAFTFGSDINTMNADGSAQTPLTSGRQGNQFPDWQPTTAAPNTAPTITNVRPVPGSTTTDRTPTIAATVTDLQTNLAKSNLMLLVDDVTIPRTAFSYNRSTDRMSYTPDKKKLSLGSHAVEVIAHDGSGLSTTERWDFEIVHP